MIDRTRVSGWDVRGYSPRPMEVFIDGHVTPEAAITEAGTQGMFVEGHINIEHQIIDLPRWHKPIDGVLKSAN